MRIISTHPDDVRRAIGGDRASLMNAFWWEITSQGHQYWKNIYNKKNQFTPEDITYLKKILVESIMTGHTGEWYEWPENERFTDIPESKE